ncbi:MAG: hypothetical protein NW216_00130 [Hyphomicrobium sp.]|nr:hypothetical protein [Hyphomicrobium sp.]
MTILVIIDRRSVLGWHRSLIDALGPASTVMNDEAAVAPEGRPASLALLLSLDAVLHGPASEACDRVQWQGPFGAARDATCAIDLTAGTSVETGCPVLIPQFDGVRGEAGLWNALLEGHAPHLSITAGQLGTIDVGRPALEMPERLRASAESVLTRMIEALLKAARARKPGALMASKGIGVRACQSQAELATTLRAAARPIVSKARRRIDRLIGQAPQWATFYRSNRRERTLEAPPLDLTAWQRLPDDGGRYYADPFVVSHGGVTHLFVEEFPYTTGRGLISHTTIDAEGRAGPPRPVLETPWHLSYPHIIEADGAIYMLPEASASGGLDLYRADPFPTRWTKVARILDQPVHDATIIRHNGKLWLFAATQFVVSDLAATSSWDALGLWSADRLEGPWTPHPNNPVLVDLTTARPAGEMFPIDGHLYRPAQDMGSGYGSALTIARVTQLEAARFAQETIARWQVSPAGALIGPHTWNIGGGIEVVDLFGPRSHLG